MADTLIREFRSRKPAAWRKLIGYSKRWSALAEPVFDRYPSVASDHHIRRFQIADSGQHGA